MLLFCYVLFILYRDNCRESVKVGWCKNGTLILPIVLNINLHWKKRFSKIPGQY